MGVKSCDFCTYEWNSRVKTPKSCPRCKRRFDYKDARIVLEVFQKKYGYDLLRSLR